MIKKIPITQEIEARSTRNCFYCSLQPISLIYFLYKGCLRSYPLIFIVFVHSFNRKSNTGNRNLKRLTFSETRNNYLQICQTNFDSTRGISSLGSSNIFSSFIKGISQLYIIFHLYKSGMFHVDGVYLHIII